MIILNGLKNFLQLINDNWTVIIVIAGLVLAITKKAKDFLSKSDEEKIQIAKEQISASMLKWISDAEVDYNEWVKAGSIKRSQVIAKIFNDYPILSQVTDQETLIKWIDDTINEALKELRKIVEENGGVPTTTPTTIAVPFIGEPVANAECVNAIELD